MLAAYEREPRKFQSFPIRHTFILTYVRFDLEGVAKQILELSTPQFHEAARNRPKFWRRHFHTHLGPFRTDPQGRAFDGTFYTDGYGVAILNRHPDVKDHAGQKRKRGRKRKDRDADYFPHSTLFHPKNSANITISFLSIQISATHYI
jgi:hypothetical protein